MNIWTYVVGGVCFLIGWIGHRIIVYDPKIAELDAHRRRILRFWSDVEKDLAETRVLYDQLVDLHLDRGEK